MEETISRMAGSENGSARTVAELTEIAALAGRPVRQRTTTYAGTPTQLRTEAREMREQRQHSSGTSKKAW